MWGAHASAAKKYFTFSAKTCAVLRIPRCRMLCSFGPSRGGTGGISGPVAGDPWPALAWNHVLNVFVRPGKNLSVQKASMDTQRDRNFPRRLDENGIYHSICLNCFQTVGTSFSQDELTEAERKHICKIPLSSGMPSRFEQASVTGWWPMRVFRM
jgi:hypothetical protein